MANIITDKNGYEYCVGDYIGRGSFSKVFKLKCCTTGNTYAGKYIYKAKLEKYKILNSVWSEIKIHHKLRHQNIVQFYSYIEEERHIILILEHCSKDSMVQILHSLKKLNSNEAKFCMLQIVSAVEYMHSNHIVHRDLKLGNLFVHKDFQIKIGDFGLAVRIDYEGQKRFSRCGTPNYLAPEIINGIGHSYAVDIWALGCILYTLLQGIPPFQGENVTSTYQNILNGKYRFPYLLDPMAKLFIVNCLNPDSNLRPNIYSLFSQQFLASKHIKPIQPNLSVQEEIATASTTGPRRTIGFEIGTSSQSRRIAKPDFLNNCYLVLWECLQNAQVWVESNFGEFLSEHSSVVPTIWVNSWIDYSHSYGFAYQLNNRNFGMVFNDDSRMLYDHEKECIHVTQTDGSILICNKDSVPRSLQKKMKLLMSLGVYMKESLLKAHEGEVSASPRRRNNHFSEVCKWAKRVEQEVAMFMTNGSVQVNFLTDHTKLIFCGCTRTVTIIESQNYMKTLKLDSIQKCGCSQLLKYKLCVSWQYINGYITNNDTQSL